MISLDFKQLDEMIEYIENNLSENISANDLSKIVGLPPYILQRVFNYITGTTITEYIKRRKLSKAYEELYKNELSITEIAFKYGYSSNSSFSRAFKKLFKILPKEVRRRGKIIAYPKLSFQESIIKQDSFKYQILKLNEMVLYGYKCEINTEYYSSQIFQLYSQLEKEQILEKMKKGTWYGITFKENDKEYYFIGSFKRFANSKKLIIPKLTYLMIKDIELDQNSIIKEEIKFHNCYLPSTSYISKKDYLYELEIYNKDLNCAIALPIFR